MGYLHQGHLSLMEQAAKENGIVIASVFVNPTQFGAGEDLAEYPRDLERDVELAAQVGVDAVFAPSGEEMYNSNHATTIQMKGLTEKLCGASRPGHFGGVCTIVSKLFNIINPDKAYFGQKDAQQVLIVQKMVEELNFPVEIRTVSIVREKDGLAVSSRNKYLSPQERNSAPVLYEALQLAKKLIDQGERKAEKIKGEMKRLIKKEELAVIDYVEVVEQNTLEGMTKIEGPILIALAVYIGETRLIDNLMMEV
jgi:pantoate--beta-alanine ligase